MKPIINPCEKCDKRSLACHDKCKKHKAYVKIRAEIIRRINANLRQNDIKSYKPAVHQTYQKR